MPISHSRRGGKRRFPLAQVSSLQFSKPHPDNVLLYSINLNYVAWPYPAMRAGRRQFLNGHIAALNTFIAVFVKKKDRIWYCGGIINACENSVFSHFISYEKGC